MSQTIPTIEREPVPRITPLGLDGTLVTFGDGLSDAANRAALAFRTAVDAEAWEGVRETATSLCSTYLDVDPTRLPRAELHERLRDLLRSRDWLRADLPARRRLWTIPACFEGAHAPQLDEAADLAGRSRHDAIAEICARPLRALTLGYAPGQAYLGTLPEHWDLARQTGLTPRVPAGALVTAVRQVIVFAAENPTGWRQIGMTHFRCFRPGEAEAPIAFAPGDEVRLRPLDRGAFDALAGTGPDGGATVEALP